MKKDLVIFGTGKIAEVVYYYAKEECGYNVAAFAIDEKYKTTEQFQDLPVILFEGIEKKFPPEKYDMFVAIGYHDLNRLRESKCNEALAKGYSLVSVISPLANVPKNVTHGINCFIMSPAIIHPNVKLGNNVFVWSGAMVGHHSKIGDHNWLTSSVNIGGNVETGNNCFLAMNATITHSVKLGDDCFIGANTLITKNAEDKAVFILEPSKPFRLNSDQFLRFSKFTAL